jgi:drug/metabolite transporter (DMT)-like permease
MRQRDGLICQNPFQQVVRAPEPSGKIHTFMMPSSSLRGIACTVLAAGLFVANDACMKAVMADAPPLQVLFMRGVAGTIWCAPLLVMLGIGRNIRHVFNPWVILRCGCEVLAVTSFVLALKHMPIADITAIYQTAPLFMLAGAALIWGERIGFFRSVLIACGIMGALLVAQPGTTAASGYAVYGFATAIGAAARDLASRKVPAGVPGFVVSFATVIVVMACAGLATAGFETWLPPSGRHLMLVALAGILLVFAHVLIFLALRLATPRTVAPFFYSFTVWAVIIGFAAFGDVPNGLAVAGIVMILAAGLAVIFLDGRPGGRFRLRHDGQT